MYEICDIIFPSFKIISWVLLRKKMEPKKTQTVNEFVLVPREQTFIRHRDFHWIKSNGLADFSVLIAPKKNLFSFLCPFLYNWSEWRKKCGSSLSFLCAPKKKQMIYYKFTSARMLEMLWTHDTFFDGCFFFSGFSFAWRNLNNFPFSYWFIWAVYGNLREFYGIGTQKSHTTKQQSSRFNRQI